jgi:hypothetical protein
MLSVFMPSVIYKPFKMSVNMLSAVMLSVVAPFYSCNFKTFTSKEVSIELDA